MRRPVLGAALVLCAATSYGLTSVLAKAAYAEGLTFSDVIGGRLLITGTVLLVIAIGVEGRAAVASRLTSDSLILGLLFGLQAICFFVAVKYVGVALSILIYFCYPALVATANRLFFRTRFARATIVALVGNLVGIALLLGEGLQGAVGGIVLCLCAPVCYTAYVLFAEVRDQMSNPLASSALTALAAGPPVLAITLLAGFSLTLPQDGRAWSVYVALVAAQAIAVPTMLAGLAYLGSTRAAIISAWEPVFTTVLAVMAFDEAIGIVGLAGGTLVVGSFVLAMIAREVSSERNEPSYQAHDA